MSGTQDYSEVVAQAEKAVATVKDPDLKKIAFQKILDDLLGARPPSKRGDSPSKAKGKRKNSTGGAPSKAGPKGYIEELIDEDFFQKPKTISEVRTTLENRGHHIALTSLSGPLQKLCQQRKLRRQKNSSGTYTYSKW